MIPEVGLASALADLPPPLGGLADLPPPLGDLADLPPPLGGILRRLGDCLPREGDSVVLLVLLWLKLPDPNPRTQTSYKANLV